MTMLAVRPLLMVSLIASIATQAGAQSKPSRAPKKPVPPKPAPALQVEVEEPPSAELLAVITKRGRLLAEADESAWRGSGAMTSLVLPTDSIRRLIPRRTARGWEVALGTLSSDEKTYLMSQLATPGIYADHWASSLYEPARADTGYFARAARAIEASVAMFRRVEDRAYVATVLPADDGPTWFVYLYPARTDDGVYPRGGDTRFRVSWDGRIVTETRRLHETIAEYSPRTARSATTKAGDAHPALLGNVPEDTDVFHVLQRRPAIPELMTAGRFQYRIDVDGTLRLIGTLPPPVIATDQSR